MGMGVGMGVGVGAEVDAADLFRVCCTAERRRVCLHCGAGADTPTAHIHSSSSSSNNNSSNSSSSSSHSVRAIGGARSVGAGMGASANVGCAGVRAVGGVGAVLPVLYGYPSPPLLKAKNLGTLHFGGDHLLAGAATWYCTYCKKECFCYPYRVCLLQVMPVRKTSCVPR
jgi:hypothetical protein